MPGPVQKFFTLVGLLKYGIVMSAVLIYLPLTAIDRVPFTKDYQLPGHDITGNLFVELTAVGVLIALMFLLALAWSIMFTEGLIVNGSENRFDKTKAPYRMLHQIQTHGSDYIPAWADVFFSIPVTGWQFLWFTILLAGPSFAVIVSRADRPILALVVGVLAFVIDYVAFIFLCTPAALLAPGDPPLQGFPLAERVWSWFGYRRGMAPEPTLAYGFSLWLQQSISLALRKLRFFYLIDPGTGLVYPMHFLAVTIVIALAGLWVAFDWIAYPGATFDVESAPVVYVYASLLLFVWLFAGLNFHLGRLHISSIAALLIFVILGYWFFHVDHAYEVTREQSKLASLMPIDVAKRSGPNLVVVASAGGGIWAAGWTTLALEKLIGARPELAREIRLLSTVSGGSVGAAYFVQGLLNDQAYQKGGRLNPDTLLDARVKATSSSLEAVAYGVAFRDFPRLVTGGIYHPTRDRGSLLDREWARIAAGKVENEQLIEKGTEEKGRCWAGRETCGFLDLRKATEDGAIPAVIFNSTVMELGRKVMITPLDFPAAGRGHARGQTLSEFLFGETSSDPVALARANLSYWTAARLSATFSFVSPAVKSDVINKDKGETEPLLWQQHLVDGGYYDNYGVASALDWLQPVLEARRDGAADLNFSRVLIVQLRGFAGKPVEEIDPSPGIKAALIGPLDAVFAIREGVAVSRDLIDVDRFINYWNRELASKHVMLETVEFVPDREQTPGPLSWYLSKADIANLKKSWGGGKEPASWNTDIRKSWCKLANFLGATIGKECADVSAVQ